MASPTSHAVSEHRQRRIRPVTLMVTAFIFAAVAYAVFLFSSVVSQLPGTGGS